MLENNPLLLVLLGAAVSLVTSVVVTAVQAQLIRRDGVRNASRSSARSLTSAFIAERDAQDATQSFLAEAELTVMAMTDRKTRDRLRDVIRLLRERELPEIEELSGVKSARARQLLCDHALEVLGAHLRAERLPEVPAQVRKMLSVEEEALSIHAGETPKPGEPIAKAQVTPRPRHNATGKAASRKTAKSSAKSGTTTRSAKSGDTATDAETEKDSAFWDD
ncbi:hypothetical protein BJF83_16775 [Nocardiopsis sp. CNR-923]|uniref:hypothetical protein n=1 Tax=Nocardiopsis sp. CNR-923 TaxID=1904965 RepID=UPI00095DB7C7|nr:hypothetical protein [Nocardiopsis sp. CNR-923]OLT27970.1 hypothetical protein BJF83_16775 [Nocardiopsis sp. CNR-923]